MAATLDLAASAASADASTSSVTVPFLVPSSVAAGDTWFCFASFRGGSAATISGVPASFNLIQRVNSGAVSTNDVLVAYWYRATGSETPGATLGTITLSGASKHVTGVILAHGAHATAPVKAGSVVTNSAAATSTSVTLGAVGATETALAAAGSQGASAQPSISDTANTWFGPSGVTTGGSAATNVTLAFGGEDGPLSSQAFSASGATGASTITMLAFVVSPAAAATKAPPPAMSDRRIVRNSLLRR